MEAQRGELISTRPRLIFISQMPEPTFLTVGNMFSLQPLPLLYLSLTPTMAEEPQPLSFWTFGKSIVALTCWNFTDLYYWGPSISLWWHQDRSRSQGFTREEIVWIETEDSAEQSRPGSQGPVEKKKWGGCLARAKDKIQRLLTAWGFMQLQEKPPQTATIEISLPPAWNGLCFSRNLRSKERERHQLNKSSPALEGESQDETEEFSYTDLCRGVTRVCPGFL